jgi:hypothetical protein
MATRNLATQEQAAQKYHVTPRTIRNWISAGYIGGYLLPNARSIRVDLLEIDMMLMRIPTTTSGRPKVRTPVTQLGPRARIEQIAYQAENAQPGAAS